MKFNLIIDYKFTTNISLIFCLLAIMYVLLIIIYNDSDYNHLPANFNFFNNYIIHLELYNKIYHK